MNELLTIITASLASASLYIIFGVGLAFVYRVTRVLNFAHGAVSSIAGYVAFTLLRHHLAYPWAVVVAILVGAVLSGAIYLLLVIHMPSRSAEAIGILTLGVAIVSQGLLLEIYGGDPKALRQPIRGGALFRVGNYGVTASTLLGVGVAIVAVVGLGTLLYRTRFGLGIRATSEGGVTASMFGISPTVVNTTVWAIGGGLGAVTVLLVAPVTQLSPSYMTFYLLVAFVAVVLGGFESIVGVVVGAIVFGILQSVVATYWTTQLTSTVSFVVIVLVLFFLPKGLLGRVLPHVPEPHLPRRSKLRINIPALSSVRASVTGPRRRSILRSSPAVLLMPLVIGAIVIAIGPSLSSTNQLLVAMIASYVIAAIGTDVIFGFSGQLSLGQAGFMLLGAYLATIGQHQYGIPYLPAILLSAIVCAVLGLIFGWPASRLSGVYLMVTTLAFALAVPELASYFPSVTGGDTGTVNAVPAWIAGFDNRNLHLLIFTVIIAAVVTVPVMAVCRSAPGRRWRAVRANEVAAAASGITVGRQKVLAFVLGAGLSGLGGALVSSVTGYLSPESFTLWDSIYLVVAVVIGGRGSALGALIGAALVVGVPYATSGSSAWSGVALGLALIVVLLVRPQGVRGLLLGPAGYLLDLILPNRNTKVTGPPEVFETPGSTPAPNEKRAATR
jgi:branched-chain amino acid transport system permease protein